jgi:dihydroflavonol-4-reductase
MSEWQQCERVNVLGTRNVVEACLRSKVRRLIHFSSIHALEQEPKDSPVDEERPLVKFPHRPPYDRSKAAGEEEVQKGITRGLDAVIINPTGIIGPYDYKPSHFGEVLLSLARGTMPVVLDSGFNWVDVRDVVVGAIEAEKRAPTGSRYLLSGPGLSCPMWLADIGAPFTTTFSRLTGKRPLFTRVSLMALRGNRNVSHEKATRELDYRPRPLRETIADTLRWFESDGQLTCHLNKD